MTKYVGHFTFSNIEADSEKEAVDLIMVCLFELVHCMELDPDQDQATQASDVRMQLTINQQQ